jgi:hypothetical protein
LVSFFEKFYFKLFIEKSIFRAKLSVSASEAGLRPYDPTNHRKKWYFSSEDNRTTGISFKRKVQMESEVSFCTAPPGILNCGKKNRPVRSGNVKAETEFYHQGLQRRFKDGVGKILMRYLPYHHLFLSWISLGCFLRGKFFGSYVVGKGL